MMNRSFPSIRITYFLVATLGLVWWINAVESTQQAPVKSDRRWRFPSFFRNNKSSQTVKEGNTVNGIKPILTPPSAEPSINTNTSNANSSSHEKSNNNNESPKVEFPAWKKTLPPILQAKGPKTLQKLNIGEATEIYLLGTAHVSNDSSADVKLLLEAVDPDCIFVELCEARIALLEGPNPTTVASSSNVTTEDTAITGASGTTTKKGKPGFWEKLNDIQQSQGGSRLQALSTLLLTSVQEDYAEALGVELGGEFRAAHRYWMAQNQATRATSDSASQRLTVASTSIKPVSLVLGDRPLSLTLVRAWESLWWWPKTKVILGLLLSSFHKPKPEEIRAWLESVLQEESDVLTQSLDELRQHFPSLHATIIAERDAWLASKLVQTCRVLSETYSYESSLQRQQLLQASTDSVKEKATKPKRKCIVAIVGAGHVPGMVQWLTGNVTTPSLSSTPEEILRNLTFTKRWEKDPMVQNEMIPLWVNEVTEVHRHQNEWSWAEPSMAALT